MKQHNMVMEHDVIVAGVSGGADSVCLFLLLEEYCRKVNAKLVTVHINHGIRDSAGADADYVRSLCEEFHVPFHLYEVKVEELAKESGIGTEEAGRKVRYEAFSEVLQSYGGKGKIAVAHNKGDQAETVLFHMFRGTNVAGMSGIAPVRDNIIRPLLCAERSEIEEYLRKKGKNWCIDCTNEENTYTRNKIRNVVLPYIEKEICSQATVHIADTAEEFMKLRQFLDEMTHHVEKEMLSLREGETGIRKSGFISLHEVMQQQIILRALESLIPGRKDIGQIHITDILSLFSKETGKQIHLPYGFVAENTYDEVVIHKKKEETVVQAFELRIPGRIVMDTGDILETEIFSADNCRNIPRKTYTKWFDYDKIINCLEIRSRKSGDYLTITQNGNRKTIKEYYIEEKIPRQERDAVLLLADGSHVLWVIGKRISEYYKVTEQTKTILQVIFYERGE